MNQTSSDKLIGQKQNQTIKKHKQDLDLRSAYRLLINAYVRCSDFTEPEKDQQKQKSSK